MSQIDILELSALNERSHFRLCAVTTVAQLHIRTVTANFQVDRHPHLRVQAQALRLFARILEHFQCLLESQLIGRHLILHAGAAFAIADERAVAADSHFHLLVLPLAQRKSINDARIDFLLAGLDQFLQPGQAIAEIESLKIFDTDLFAARDRVEVIFEVCSVLVVDEIGEVFLKQPNHSHGRKGGHQRGPLLERVAAIENQFHDRGPGAGAADSQLFQFADQ